MEANNALDLKKDLFFGLDRRKHPNPKGRRGNLFSVLLGRFDRIQSAQSLVEAAMPLLGWCLPGDEHPGRLASLAAVLVAADVRKICEHQQIINAPAEFYSMECSSRIEGAHIKPHVRGGSASLSNGLWLCKSHHVASEGRIYGIRTKCRWNSKTAQKTAIKKGKGCDSLGIQAITPVEIFNSNPPLIYGHALHRHS